MKFTKIFENMGLLQQSEDEDAFQGNADEVSSRSDVSSASLDKPANANPEAEILGTSEVQENQDIADEVDEARSLGDIYREANIPPSPFSANKLLKLLEGLSTLPEETRNQAVMAMDAAEDSWTIEDPLLDAQRCIQALEGEDQRLVQVAKQAEARATTELQAQDEYEQQATAQIRQQISELEKLLEEELRSVAEKRESIKTKVKLTRQTCQRQQTGLQKEINRLRQISKLFSMNAVNPESNHPSGTQHG